MNDREARSGPQIVAAPDPDLPVEPEAPTAIAVPNVSEGEHGPTLRAFEDAIRACGAHVLDRHTDVDHGRSVLTVAGDPLSVQDGLVALAGECLDRIDIRRHRGTHPRVGALDVAPIVARRPEDLGLACEIARGLAHRIGEELMLPVFLYGEVASRPDRDRPHHFREGGLEGLAARMEEGEIAPDAGPPRLHPTAGAVLVGVRGPLIAWNVELPDGSLTDARAIAARVRETGGGLPTLRALGLYLGHSGVPQVSMNLEDYRVTPPAAAVAAVRREAERLGVRAGDSELVGLIPADALRGASTARLGLRGFRPGQLLEAQLRAAGRERTGV